MSLNYQLEKIESYKTLCWLPDKEAGGEKMNPITEGLIFSMMSIDIGEITENNLPEVMFRLRLYSRIMGKPITQIKDSFDYAVEEVRAHIGLYTNVGNKSRAYFIRKMMKQLAWDTERDVKNLLKPKEVQE